MYDNHPGDIGSEIFEREKDISLNEHAEFHLKQVNEALARMESGEYGICVFSHQPIPMSVCKPFLQPYTALNMYLTLINPSEDQLKSKYFTRLLAVQALMK